MSSNYLLPATRFAAMASLLAVAPGLIAAAKESKEAKKPVAVKFGVKTPGVQIPFASLKSDAEIKLEAAPTGVAFTTEILISAGNTVQRVDAKTNKTGEALTGFDKACGGLLNAFSNVWVVNCGSKTLAKASLKPAKIAATIESGAGKASPALAASTDSIWQLSSDNATLSRIDPKENTVVADLRLPAGCNSILFAENSLWVTCPAVDRVLRIDPRTNLVDKRIEVAGKPSAVAFGAASIWVLAEKEGKVAQIDPKTNKVSTTIDLSIPNAAGNIAFGDGSVWLSAPGFPITRINPETGKVVQQFTGEGAGTIYSGLNSIWLANPQTKTVTRFDPKRIVATLAD